MSLWVATGAFSVGKTTTLRRVARRTGGRLHPEAHGDILAALGARTEGHPPDAPFTAIVDDDHLCPMCRPRTFADTVVERQRAIEAAAEPPAVLDRGLLDPLELRSRRTGEPLRVLIDALDPPPRYAGAFLFEVIDALQQPRWGRSGEERCAEARTITERLDAAYRGLGIRIVRIPPGTVEERSRVMVEAMSSRYR